MAAKILLATSWASRSGMIRTEELLAARRIDGGRQYFTRAFDFGFSKTIDETYEHWPKDSILEDDGGDRARFSAAGHHRRLVGHAAGWARAPSVLGVLAREVFDAAADSVRLPPVRCRWTSALDDREVLSARGERRTAALTFNVGEYDALLGRTYSEIATESRSEHRCRRQAACRNRARASTQCASRCHARLISPAPVNAACSDGLDSGWTRSRIRLADSVRRSRLAAGCRAAGSSGARPEKPGNDCRPARAVRSPRVARRASGVACTTLTSEQHAARLRGRDRRSRAGAGFDARSRVGGVARRVWA